MRISYLENGEYKTVEAYIGMPLTGMDIQSVEYPFDDEMTPEQKEWLNYVVLPRLAGSRPWIGMWDGEKTRDWRPMTDQERKDRIEGLERTYNSRVNRKTKE